MKSTFKIYSIFSIGFILAQLSDNTIAENLSKPLIMISLIIGFALYKRWDFKGLDKAYLMALVFSLLGDIFLMPLFDSFVLGLISFLVAHFFYIFIFSKDRQKPIVFSRKNIGLGLLGLASYGTLLFFIFYNTTLLSSSLLLSLAIIVYASALLLMFLTALLRSKHHHSSYNYILLGATFFLISDSFLAINKFVYPLPYSTLWVIPAYTLAQAFICYGYINRKLISNHSK